MCAVNALLIYTDMVSVGIPCTEEVTFALRYEQVCEKSLAAAILVFCKLSPSPRVYTCSPCCTYMHISIPILHNGPGTGYMVNM